ncbi:MAG: hypothetical protein K2O16_20215 [Lachnospiraceae bacterium]|nr:hypothetical protein [Lachnospiraceae bacterium]MDE7334509.1 hypothetical protein [Lachnospiraceae bacterium]
MPDFILIKHKDSLWSVSAFDRLCMKHNSVDVQAALQAETQGPAKIIFDATLMQK